MLHFTSVPEPSGLGAPKLMVINPTMSRAMHASRSGPKSKSGASIVLKLLIDTSVWLDLAKDYRNLALLTILGELVDRGDVELLVPDVVLDEFQRNRNRVLKSAKASQAEVFKRARNAVKQFAPQAKRADVLRTLDDVSHKIAIHGDASNESMQGVETLLAGGTPIVPSVFARSRATNRGLEMLAPFSRKKNSVADAVLIETYGEIVEEETDTSVTFAFVTANTTDFSAADDDARNPHADIASFFDGKRSIYSTGLDRLIREPRLDLDIDEDLEFMFFSEDPRLLSEIKDAIDLLWHQVWYNRHRILVHKVETGEIELIDDPPETTHRYDPNKLLKSVWKIALEAGERTEEKYGGQLGPWDDFDWGMLNGKLSALRWALGDEWDMLDT